MHGTTRRFGRRRRGRGRCASGRTDGRGIPLAERLRRMLERRVGEAARRGGRGLSVEDLSAAVVDISRLVTASARLGKLDRPERETGPESSDSVAVRILSIMQAASQRGESANDDARPAAGEPGAGRT